MNGAAGESSSVGNHCPPDPPRGQPLNLRPRRVIVAFIAAGTIILGAPALGYAQSSSQSAQVRAQTDAGNDAERSLAAPNFGVVARQDDNEDGDLDNEQMAENDNSFDDEDTAGNQNGNDNFGDFADEASFLTGAVSDSATEIEAGRLAQERAASPDVRQLAERVMHENESTIQEAATVAARNGLDTTWEPGTDQEKQLIADLSARSGDEFDRLYLRAFVLDQRADISTYDAAKAGMRDDVAAYADQHLWMLEDQLRAATELAERMNVDVD
jgi:putative membrane protein